MTHATTKRLFACYSRKDARYVHDLVKLLRITGAPVYLDVDSIPAGKKWLQETEAAIAAADAVVVFWSDNASSSEQVTREYELAIRLGKDVVPVLMGLGSDMPPLLAPYQAVDLQDLFCPHDVTFNPAPYVALFVERLNVRPNA